MKLSNRLQPHTRDINLRPTERKCVPGITVPDFISSAAPPSLSTAS